MSGLIDIGLLERTCTALGKDPAFRKLGSADMVAGIKAGDAAFSVTFEAVECAGAEQIEIDQLRDTDFYLELPSKAWQRYLVGRKAGKGPSLSGLDLETDGGILRGSEPLKTLKFERYIGTLQAFFDKSATLL
jgi:hypothetical protein